MATIISMIDKVYDRVLSKVPPKVAANVDWYRGRIRSAMPGNRGSMQNAFGGPFNGQERRREIVNALFDALPFGAFVETGTHRGVTTDYVDRRGVPVHTVELMERMFYFAQKRFQGRSGIHLTLGDSRAFLRDLARSQKLKEPVFFYLDAHWYEDLPLQEELELIPQSWNDWLIMIDDFRVDDDPGYAFDNYGPGKVVSLDILPPIIRERAAVYWPAAPSSRETGYRRGSAFIASRGRVAEAAAKIDLLRPVLSATSHATA